MYEETIHKLSEVGRTKSTALMRSPFAFLVGSNECRALSYCLEASCAKGMSLFSGNLAADGFPLSHGLQSVIADFGSD